MKTFNNSLATNKLRQEMSVTGPGEVYQVKKKKNPYSEDEMSGYKEMKGFRAGHTKDTGGFQYKDLWDVNENYKDGDKVRVTADGNIHFNDIGVVVDYNNGAYTIQFDDDTVGTYQANQLTKPAGVKDFEDKPELRIDEEEVGADKKAIKLMRDEFYNIRFNDEIIPAKFLQYADKDKFVFYVQNKGRVELSDEEDIISLAENMENNLDNEKELARIKKIYDETIEVGDKVRVSFPNSPYDNSVGEVVSKTIKQSGPHYTVKFDEDGYTEEFHHTNVKPLKVFQPSQRAWAEYEMKRLRALIKKQNSGLQENYSRFKKETVTRSKEQQMHEAMKLVRKKLYEADKVMTYVKTMKEELGLQEYKSHTSRLMEKLQVSIAEIYKKYKEIK